MAITKMALIAPRRSGKSTVAQYLEENYDFLIYSFGEQLKKQFHKDYPHVPRVPKPVAGYQHYGQLMREVENKDIWINHCFSRINEDQEWIRGINETYPEADGYYSQPNVVIDDLRQSNELQRCRDEGFYTVRIARSEGDRIQGIQKENGDYSLSSLTHSTETELKGAETDFFIENKGSLDSLYSQVDHIMEQIRERQ